MLIRSGKLKRKIYGWQKGDLGQAKEIGIRLVKKEVSERMV